MSEASCQHVEQAHGEPDGSGRGGDARACGRSGTEKSGLNDERDGAETANKLSSPTCIAAGRTCVASAQRMPPTKGADEGSAVNVPHKRPYRLILAVLTLLVLQTSLSTIATRYSRKMRPPGETGAAQRTAISTHACA